MEKVFGYEWEQIQAMQQKQYVAPTINLHRTGKREITESDRKLFAQYGSAGALRDAGFNGVADLFE